MHRRAVSSPSRSDVIQPLACSIGVSSEPPSGKQVRWLTHKGEIQALLKDLHKVVHVAGDLTKSTYPHSGILERWKSPSVLELLNV